MTEYITKAQALSAMRKATNCTWDDIWNTEYVLKSVPAADVAPVVHAYWRGIEGDGYDPDGNIVWDTFECSNCGEEHHADGEPEWDYCPQCGARMGGEEE